MVAYPLYEWYSLCYSLLNFAESPMYVIPIAIFFAIFSVKNFYGMYISLYDTQLLELVDKI